MGHMFLIIVDSHSKWLNVHVSSIMDHFDQDVFSVFAIYELPQKVAIVTLINGPSFTSQEFSEFMQN